MAATLAYRFRDAALREQALTHRSVGRSNNERLEFLGDALVNLVVAELLFEAFPKADEGELTRLRARLVSEPALAELAREIELGDSLKLGPCELKSGGFRRDSILADGFEALIAAIYLDGGWDECRRHARELFAQRIALATANQDKDPKTRLQELLQAQRLPLPTYELVTTHGAEHAKTFEVACSVADVDPGVCGSGRGSSRRAAEQAAAMAVLALLENRTGHAKPDA